MTKSIQIHNLSKRYILGLTHSRSIRDMVNNFAGNLFGKKEDAKKEDAEKGEFWALKDISFDVNQGEVIGIVGKNGAGKSTLLKILSKITTPTTGQVKIFGRTASLLEVGTGFHPELTGRENIFLNGTILGMTKTEIASKFDQIVEFSGIEQFIDTPVKRYSSGMFVRLAFAVAAHLDPEILIVDEVLAVGDMEFQKRCMEKMDRVSKSGRTVLFVSHNMASIRALTHRAVLLSKGEIVRIGPTEEVLNYYSSPELLSGVASQDDVSELERSFSGLDRTMEFQKLGFINQQNIPAQIENEKLEIRMVLNFHERIKDFQIGMTVYRDDHTPIGSTFSPIISSHNAGAQSEYLFEMPIAQIAPGRYHCAISLVEAQSRATRLYDSLSDVLPFEIPQGAMDEYTWKRAWGPIQLDEMALLDKWHC